MRALLIIGRRQGSDALELLNPTANYRQSSEMVKSLIKRIHGGDKTYAHVSIYEAEPARVLRPRIATEPAESKQPTIEKKGKK